MLPFVIIGGGPAGLMAAEVLAQHQQPVQVYDAMPTMGRKFLLAGKGGLNLTHAEPFSEFVQRYGTAQAWLEPLLAQFGALELRAWAKELGIDTFAASTGRVYPRQMRTAPLLRAWLQRLSHQGVQFLPRYRWLGWEADGRLKFASPQGIHLQAARATILALGGGSWARMGSTGEWVQLLMGKGIPIRHLRPANCGFNVQWSEHLRQRFAGSPLKTIAMQFGEKTQAGECILSEYGLEGSLIYAFSALLRDALEVESPVTLWLDLLPAWTVEKIQRALQAPRGKRSLSHHLERTLGLQGVKTALLWEFLPKETLNDPARLAYAIKHLPIPLLSPRPLAEAISTAGGVPQSELDENLMLRTLPGVFCAGEMLDWEAPTGGYLLTACFSTGRRAGVGALAYSQSSA